MTRDAPDDNRYKAEKAIRQNVDAGDRLADVQLGSYSEAANLRAYPFVSLFWDSLKFSIMSSGKVLR